MPGELITQDIPRRFHNANVIKSYFLHYVIINIVSKKDERIIGNSDEKNSLSVDDWHQRKWNATKKEGKKREKNVRL